MAESRLRQFFATLTAMGLVVLLLLLVGNAGTSHSSIITPYDSLSRASCALIAPCHQRAIGKILGSPDFLPGAVTLADSISKHAPTVDKVLIMPNDRSSHGFTSDHIQLLERVGFTLKPFDDLPLPMSADGKDDKLVNPRYYDMLMKLRAWGLVEYSSIAFLDNDVLFGW
ncbi:hypothetical protein PV11_01818 [Exophiala sideris]|uniref:Nucleotide-diphospho-sugar transferase domain-containing protein n=1 Tax=Exophiala sideris TaxID=1016849 RepID=A0A0D1ZH96_9EURO|nr:hypothetical protein PV11_01818 [Exophiala sideris]